MTLFFIGVLEMIIITFWTKWVAETKVVASGLMTFVNIMIWYYVLQKIVDNIDNWRIALIYALGCSLGTIVSTLLITFVEKKEVLIKN